MIQPLILDDLSDVRIGVMFNLGTKVFFNEQRYYIFSVTNAENVNDVSWRGNNSHRGASAPVRVTVTTKEIVISVRIKKA